MMTESGDREEVALVKVDTPGQTSVLKVGRDTIGLFPYEITVRHTEYAKYKTLIRFKSVNTPSTSSDKCHQ